MPAMTQDSLNVIDEPRVLKTTNIQNTESRY
jgi:hypothetical protein